MNVKAAYRLIRHGEVIHSQFIPETREIIGMPVSFAQMDKYYFPEYSVDCYHGVEEDFSLMCEAVLLSDARHCLVVECCNIGYYVLDWNGRWFIVQSPTDEDDTNVIYPEPNTGNFKEIGFRPTRARQLRSSPGVYRLTMERETGLVYTNEGVFTLGFDPSKLSPLMTKYEGYMDTVNTNAFAVVYFGSTPVLLDKAINNVLVPRH